MFAAVAQRETLGELIVPPHVDTLVDIHEEEESKKDRREIPIYEFLEENTKLHHIESLRHVHHATEDLTVVPEEVADGFDDDPGAHEVG